MVHAITWINDVNDEYKHHQGWGAVSDLSFDLISDFSKNQTYVRLHLTPVFIKPWCAKFFRGNINIYLHFITFLHIDMTQVVEIFPQVRQGLTYSA